MKKILINREAWQTRVAVLSNDKLQDIYYDTNSKEDLERYRIDVWTEEDSKRKIGYSYFVHYDTKDDVLIDKTIHKQRKLV